MTTVFVHSWFRSSSTWLWSKFRNDERFVAYYEPLNEELPVWTPQRLETAPAHAFDGDNHPSLDRHYFYEYIDLIASGRLHFDKTVSYARYFLKEGEDDRTLQHYLSGLILDAANTGRRPALCFCRSQMRASWMKEKFAGVHIAQIRNPWDQWISFGKHAYFRSRVLLTAYCIDKQRPGCFSHVPGFAPLAAAWDAGRQAQIGEIECFSIFSMLWIASAVQAVGASDIIADVDLLASSDAARHTFREQLAGADLPADISDYMPPRQSSASALPDDLRRELNNAVSALRGSIASSLLPPNRHGVGRKLGSLSETSAGLLQSLLA